MSSPHYSFNVFTGYTKMDVAYIIVWASGYYSQRMLSGHRDTTVGVCCLGTEINTAEITKGKRFIVEKWKTAINSDEDQHILYTPFSTSLYLILIKTI